MNDSRISPNAAVYIPTRGYVFCEVITALNDLGICPYFMRGSVAWSMVMNKIVEDFLLRNEADILLCIDDDTIPPQNLLAITRPILDGGFDVVGAPTMISKPGLPAYPNIYVRTDDEGEYEPDPSPRNGVVEVDAVGSACLAMSREILEKVKAPFLEEFHPNGIIKLGGDLNFCKKVYAAGGKVAAHYDVVCEHFTTMHVNERQMTYINALRGADES